MWLQECKSYIRIDVQGSWVLAGRKGTRKTTVPHPGFWKKCKIEETGGKKYTK
jgi:hypothetical protein